LILKISGHAIVIEKNPPMT